jgi:hypothetical protein
MVYVTPSPELLNKNPGLVTFDEGIRRAVQRFDL